MAIKTVLKLLLCSCLFYKCEMYSYDDTLNFFKVNFRPQCESCHTEKVFPRTDQSDQITVDINFTILSIGDFNEPDGFLEVNGLLDIMWDDQLISVQASTVKEISMPRDDVWVPTISIFNAHSNMSMVGDASTDVRMTMPSTTDPGEMKWSPSIVSKTNCPVDSTYFPFDTQKCNITLTPWGYKDTEINISITNESLDVSLFRDHELWNLKTYQSNTENKDNQSFVFYELTLQRKPKYFLLMFYLPFLLLIFLSNLVFLIPSNSGERVGFSILVFLAVAVFMALVTESLPKSSTQMSIMSYYFTIMMVVIAVIIYLAILSLTIHSKDPRNVVPLRIVGFIAFCGCYENKHKDDLFRNKVSPLSISEYDDNDDEYFSHPKFWNEIKEDYGPVVRRKDNKAYPNDYDMTWRDVANTFDKMCFIIFAALNFIITMMFLSPLLAHYNVE